jgi:hypothetical protein
MPVAGIFLVVLLGSRPHTAQAVEVQCRRAQHNLSAARLRFVMERTSTVAYSTAWISSEPRGRLMDWMMVVGGCVGGAIPDAIRIVQGRYSGPLPGYVWTVNFWLGFILLLLLGGFASWLGDAKAIKEALAYGFAAPEIISRLLSSSTPPTLGGPGGTIRHFWSY